MAGVFRTSDPPPPHRPASVYIPPAFGAGVGHTLWVESGWGVNSSEDDRHCLYSIYVSTLCIRLTGTQLCIYSPHRWASHHLRNQSLRSIQAWSRHETYLHSALHIFSSQMSLSSSMQSASTQHHGWSRHETFLHQALHIFSSQMGFSSSTQSASTQHSGLEQTWDLPAPSFAYILLTDWTYHHLGNHGLRSIPA